MSDKQGQGERLYLTICQASGTIFFSGPQTKAAEIAESGDQVVGTFDPATERVVPKDADEICFLYRDCVYNPTADPNEAELIVRKRRDGPIGTVKFWFDKATGRFSETVYERQTA